MASTLAFTFRCVFTSFYENSLGELLVGVTASSLLVTFAAWFGLAWFASGSQILSNGLNEDMAKRPANRPRTAMRWPCNTRCMRSCISRRRIRSCDGSDGIDNAGHMALLNLQDFGDHSCHHLWASSPCKTCAWSIVHERKICSRNVLRSSGPWDSTSEARIGRHSMSHVRVL
jgi:hypothetical protein